MSKQNIFTSLISLIPLSYIIGNFILNLNVVIIILAGFFLYNKGERLKINIVDKLMIFAFSYIILTGLWNTTESYFFGYTQNKDLTIISITHRKEALKYCNKIIELSKGSIVKEIKREIVN